MSSRLDLGIQIIDESYRDFFAALRTSELLEAGRRSNEVGIGTSGGEELRPDPISAEVRAGLHRSLEKNLGTIITPDPESISLDATLIEAARKMRMSGLGILLVREQDRLVGAVTDRDIVRAVADGLDPNTTTLRHRPGNLAPGVPGR